MSILKAAQAAARVVPKVIRNSKDDISQIAQISRDSMLITLALINTDQSYLQHQISRIRTKQQNYYKTEGRLQNSGIITKQLDDMVVIN